MSNYSDYAPRNTYLLNVYRNKYLLLLLLILLLTVVISLIDVTAIRGYHLGSRALVVSFRTRYTDNFRRYL